MVGNMPPPLEDSCGAEQAHKWVEESCAAQGIPSKLCDPRWRGEMWRSCSRLAEQSCLVQTFQTGVIRLGSNLLRPCTAGPTTMESSKAATTARWRAGEREFHRPLSASELPT